MKEHTPGPWRAAFFAGQWCVLHRGGDETTVLAPVTGGFGEDSNGEANALLMAAAPDMLEALRKLRNEVVGWLSAFELDLRAAVGNTNFAVLQQRADEASAAITRAARGANR